MDILEEIEETLKDKKGKWKYTPMRETSETDAIIDELLREFSSDSRQKRSVESYSRPAERYRPQVKQQDYDTKSEQEEREEYNRSMENSSPLPNDATQVYSINDIPQDDASGNYNNYNGAFYGGDDGNDDYDDYDDEYYDDEFDDSHKMNNDEFNQFLDSEDDSNRDYVPSAKRSPWKTAWRIIYTAVIAAFTIIGIFSSVIFCIEKFEMMPDDNTAQNEELKSEVEKVIYPLVETQVGDFESFDDISPEEMVNIAVWEIIINGDINVFKDSDSEDFLIPQTQVEYISEKLFGNENSVENVSSGINDVTIIYDEDKSGYIVPSSYYIYTMYPVVTDVSVTDDTYTVSVDCFYDAPAWRDGKKTTPGKKMVFTLQKTADYYNITSAKTVS